MSNKEYRAKAIEPIKYKNFNAEEVDYLRNLKGMTWLEMAKCFNEKYNHQFNAKQIQCVCKYHHIPHESQKGKRVEQQREGILKAYQSIREYTDEMRQFLIDNCVGTHYRDLANMFNAKFGKNKSPFQIRQYCVNILNIKSGAKKCMPNELNPNWKPVGSEAVEKGNLYIKISDNEIGRKKGHSYTCNPNWKRKDLYIWEDVHKKGKVILRKQVLFHLDNNPFNCDIDNLILISSSVLQIMMFNEFDDLRNKEATLAAIKWAELRMKQKQGKF